MAYRSSLREAAAGTLAEGDVPDVDVLEKELLATLAEVRDQEIERGVCLVGPLQRPHLTLGSTPRQGVYQPASLVVRAGTEGGHHLHSPFDLGEDPVLVLDDVFAELDSGRRDRLARMIEACEQVLITAAVVADVPEVLRVQGTTFTVALSEVTRVA